MNIADVIRIWAGMRGEGGAATGAGVAAEEVVSPRIDCIDWVL